MTSAERLGRKLESVYRLYGPETAATDPIVFVGRFAHAEDREVAGWIASAFAYGQVRTIQDNVGRILAALGPEPASGVDAFTEVPSRAWEALRGFRHRFHKTRDAAALLYVIGRARQEGGGSLRAFFEARQHEDDRDVGPLLSRVVAWIETLDFRPVLGTKRLPERSPVRFFFPDPAAGSACKRWNLFLRWMVRRDALDFGLWPGIPTDRLVVPTDVHIHRIARRLGLTRRRTPDWKTARAITDSLARFDPRDPVRFDYALCRIGILDICRPRPSLCRCAECPVQEACGLGRRRAYAVIPRSAATRQPSTKRQTPGSRQRRAERGVHPVLDCESGASSSGSLAALGMTR